MVRLRMKEGIRSETKQTRETTSVLHRGTGKRYCHQHGEMVKVVTPGGPEGKHALEREPDWRCDTFNRLQLVEESEGSVVMWCSVHFSRV